MADTIKDVKLASSTMYLPATVDSDYGLATAYTDNGEVIDINGQQIPLINEDFRMSVVQPGSVASEKFLAKHVGQIRLHLGEEITDHEFYDELYVVPLAELGYSFAKFGQYDANKVSTPLCSSYNGLTPTIRGDIVPVSNVCAKYDVVNGEVRCVPVCPDASWVDGNKPTCTMSIRVAFMTLPRCIPVTMSLHGVGLGRYNAFKKQRKKAFNVARIKQRDISRYVVKLFTDNKGTYVTAEFSFVEAPEEFGPIGEYLAVARYMRDTLFGSYGVDPLPKEPEPAEEEAVLEPETVSL